MLTDDEQVEVWRAVRAAVDVPLIAGSGTNDTAHAGELTARAAGAGLDGVLVVTPYYNRPPQAGIEAHFRAVAAATDLPGAALRHPDPHAAARSATRCWSGWPQVPNIVGLKDATGNPAETARSVADTPGRLRRLRRRRHHDAADDGGGRRRRHQRGRPLGRARDGAMIAAFERGDHTKAAEINATLLESYDFETSELTPNPMPAKAMLRALGQPAGQCRLPMGPAPDGLEAASARRAGAASVADDVKITFLGGLGEIGRNCACIELDDRIMILDCGLMFPDADMPGIDLVLPDFTYLRENADRVEGCIVTHGHEDHHGGLSFLLRELSFPIYGSALSLGLARNRIEEAGLLDRTELDPGQPTASDA